MLKEGTIVNVIVDPATGLPLKFPDPAEEAYARAQEFRRLSPEERWKQISELMEIGMNMCATHPGEPKLNGAWRLRKWNGSAFRRSCLANMARDSTISDEMRHALAEAMTAMEQHKVPYALIGGLATSYRSQPRFTKDVDFLVKVPQLVLPALLEDLHQRGFEFDTIATIGEWAQHHMAVLSYHGIRIDWLKPLIPVYLHVLDRATEENWLDQPIRIASAEGLILLKLIAFRSQDQVDIENLVAANRDTLDLAWIKAEWQTLAGLDDARFAVCWNW